MKDRRRRGIETSSWVGDAVPRCHRCLATVSNETELNRAGVPSSDCLRLPSSSKLHSSFLPSTASIIWYRSHSHQVMIVKTVKGTDTTAKIQTWREICKLPLSLRCTNSVEKKFCPSVNKSHRLLFSHSLKLLWLADTRGR